MKKRARTLVGVYCPDCDGRILLDSNVEWGLKLICPHCHAELEVISIDPPEVDGLPPGFGASGIAGFRTWMEKDRT